MAEVGRTHRGSRVRARVSSPREVVVSVERARRYEQGRIGVRGSSRVSFTGHPEESASYVKAYGGRSRRKAFWIVRNACSSPGVREAVLTCG